MTALEVDLASGVPPYEQVRAQIAGHVAAGTLRDGDRLPTVRDLASDLGVAVGTVQRAYRELEAAGTVVSRRRHGTSVTAPRGAGTAEEDARASVVSAAHDLVRGARAAGLGDEAVLDLVRGVLSATAARRGTP